MNPFLRESMVVVDSLGIDPLQDPRYKWLRSVTKYTSIVLPKQYENRPDLLALDYYADQDKWWIILFYNGFVGHHELLQGTNVKLPDLTNFNMSAKQLPTTVVA